MEKGACLLHKSSIWTRWVLVPSPCCPQVYDSSWLRACATLPVSDPWRRIVQLPGSGVPLRPQTQPQEARLPQPADSRAHTIPHGAASPAAVAAFHRASVCSHHDPPQACSSSAAPWVLSLFLFPPYFSSRCSQGRFQPGFLAVTCPSCNLPSCELAQLVLTKDLFFLLLFTLPLH